MLRYNFLFLGLRRSLRTPITPVRFAPALLTACVFGCVSDGEPAPPLTGAVTEVQQLRPTSELEAVVVEAESGENGAELEVVVDADNSELSYITASVDNTNPPADLTDPRISTSEVAFGFPGQYQVLARVRIGPGGASDDSFYINVPAGEEPNWVFINGLSGFTTEGENGYQAGAIVDEVGGNAETGVWKWTLLPNLRVVVPEGQLEQTFQFATRENGLDIDKFAFALVGDGFTTGFTTAQLDAGEPGIMVLPPPIPDDYEPPADQLPLAVASTKYLGMVCCGTQRPALENYFNQITPENAGKWGSVEGTRDVYNWDGIDEALALAEANNFPFRYHVLLWGSQQPAWMAALPPEEQLEEIREWMEAVNERYGTRIDYLEVVNEFVNQPPRTEDGQDFADEGNYIEALGGAGESGFDWVLTGFRMAREIFPDTVQLMLNEYSVINSDELTETYVQLVGLLQEENLIDALGAQGHAFSTRGDEAAMVSRLSRLGETGLSVYITEMDVDGPPMQQLIDYQRLFRAFWESPAVGGITLWGYRPGMWREAQEATLVYNNGAEKPALRWLKGYLGDSAPSVDGPANATSAADDASGTEVASFTTDANGAAVSWGIAASIEEVAITNGFAFVEGTGRLERTGPIAAGTYTVRVYVDVDAVVSDLFDVEITVE